MTLDESGLFGITLADVTVDEAFSGRFTVGLTAHLDIKAAAIDLTRGGYRHSRFKLRATNHARFDTADLSHTPNLAIDELLLLVDLDPWPDEASAVTLFDCEFGSSSFSDALLQGCVFERCEFGAVTFTGAYIDHCRFTDCLVNGAPLRSEDLQGAFGQASIGRS